MKEYIRGAFQALAWVRMILSNVKDMPGLEKALTQIDQALETLRNVAAKDFPQDMQSQIKQDASQGTR